MVSYKMIWPDDLPISKIFKLIGSFGTISLFIISFQCMESIRSYTHINSFLRLITWNKLYLWAISYGQGWHEILAKNCERFPGENIQNFKKPLDVKISCDSENASRLAITIGPDRIRIWWAFTVYHHKT